MCNNLRSELSTFTEWQLKKKNFNCIFFLKKIYEIFNCVNYDLMYFMWFCLKKNEIPSTSNTKHSYVLTTVPLSRVADT